jgi:nucleoside-diphosphate-sugar epimerase
MKILVTGGAGYIGSVLVEALLSKLTAWDDSITVIDNFMWRQTSLNHLCSNRGLEIVKADCRDFRVVGPLFERADLIIPLAALVGAPLCEANKEAAVSTNLHAINKMAAIASKDQRFIVPISNSGYGIGEPGKECTEKTPMRPISLYGRTKPTW